MQPPPGPQYPHGYPPPGGGHYNQFQPQMVPPKKSNTTLWVVLGCGGLPVVLGLGACGVFYMIGSDLPESDSQAPQQERPVPAKGKAKDIPHPKGASCKGNMDEAACSKCCGKCCSDGPLGMSAGTFDPKTGCECRKRW